MNVHSTHTRNIYFIMINSSLFIYIVNIGGNLININDHIDDRNLRHWLIFTSFSKQDRCQYCIGRV